MYYLFHKQKLLPSQYYALERGERAFIVAAIKCKIESDKEEDRKQKAKMPRKKR